MYGGTETQFHLIHLLVNSPWYRFDGGDGRQCLSGPCEEKKLLILPESVFVFFNLIPFNFTICPETFSNLCGNSVNDM